MMRKMEKDYFYDTRCIAYLYIEKNNEAKNTGEIIIYKGHYKKDIYNDESYIVVLNGDIKYSINTANGIYNLISVIKLNLFIDITNKNFLFVSNQKRNIEQDISYSTKIKYVNRLVKFKNNLFLLK